VAHKLARTLVVLTLLALAPGRAAWATPPDGREPPPKPERVVFLGSGLSALDLLTFTTAVAAGSDNAVVLLDSEKCTPYTRALLGAYHADRVIPVGGFPLGVADLKLRLDTPTAPEVAWSKGRPAGLWRLLFPRAARVVVCPAEPRALLLQSACLAGALRAPLFVLGGADGEADELREWLSRWHAHTVYSAGGAAGACRGLKQTNVELADEREVAAAYLRCLLRQGPVTSLVVTNPEDLREGFGGMSVLAPWVALQRRAALLCTDPAGDDAEDVVRAALRSSHLRHADALILVANLKAIPMTRRPNPIPTDRDAEIEMEPFTPAGSEPFTFATGRLFHEDPAVVPLLLAREKMLLEGPTPRKALVVSNPGGSLPLLETFSRNTAKELRNAGYDTTVRFGRTTSGEELRRLLPEHDLFLWEGHQSTLIRDWSLPDWDEPLPPSLVFLQSCLALQDWKAQPLLRRGAVGVLGSSTRTYSASGGACSLAFFDALLYDRQSLGGSLRQAKNFLAVYARLKEKRLGKDAKRTGANLRSAWAFTLWGDPTLRLPLPEAPADALPPVRHEVRGNTIVLALPAEHHDKVSTSRFQVAMYPNGRLAGLCRKETDEDGLPLVPFVFAEVALPKGRPGQVPELHSRLPSSHWVFSWDGRRRCGYLIAVPRAKDRDELRFTVRWTDPAADAASSSAGQ
jgi:hypothetical protein